MILAIEIILTISAWKRGWKAWALAPLGAAFFIGLVVGAANPGISADEALGIGIVFDVMAIIALGIMVAKGRVDRPVHDGTIARAASPSLHKPGDEARPSA